MKLVALADQSRDSRQRGSRELLSLLEWLNQQMDGVPGIAANPNSESAAGSL
jgi:hypothetical protein